MADLANRSQFEADFAKRMSRLSSRHRRRLIELLGNPPDQRRVPAEFWKQCEEEDRRELELLLLLIWMGSATQHAAAGGGDLKHLTPILMGTGTLWAANRSAHIASKMTQNSRQMLADAATQWQARRHAAMSDAHDEILGTGGKWTEYSPLEIENRLKSALAEAQPKVGEIHDMATTIFGPNRADSLAITETTTAISAGGDAGIDNTVGTSPDDLWKTEHDGRVCPICSKLHNKPRSEWGRYFWSGPPAHPRCRCFVQHVNVANAVAALPAM